MSIQPIVSYPREAEIGKTYLMTVDVQATLKEDWPYHKEEIALHCIPITTLFKCESLGEPIIVLNRFGGTYGSASFILTAPEQVAVEEIEIRFLNQSGIPVHVTNLENIVVSKGKTRHRHEITVEISGFQKSAQVGLSLLRQRMMSLNSDSIYFTLVYITFDSLLQTSKTLDIVITVSAMLGSVRKNTLAATLVELSKLFKSGDHQDSLTKLKEKVLDSEELAESVDVLLEKLEVFSNAREVISQDHHTWFVTALFSELTTMGNWWRFHNQIVTLDQLHLIATSKNVSTLTSQTAVSLHPQSTEYQPNVHKTVSDYLTYVANRYYYIEFKGMGITDRIPLSLSLISLYVPLRVRIKVPEGEIWGRDLRLAGREISADEVAATGSKSQSISSVQSLLSDNSVLVLLGDPGSGKTTLLKYLALCMALGQDVGFGQRLPIVIPVSSYANVLQNNRSLLLHTFIPQYISERLGDDYPVGHMVDWALSQGHTLILFDGLDEVQDLSISRVVHEEISRFILEFKEKGNKFVITSRIVGYKEFRLQIKGQVECTLTDYSLADIEAFVEKWTMAFELLVQSDRKLAAKEAQIQKVKLLEVINHNTGVRSLAANPLLLTVFMLITRQGVALPERRVELYDAVVKVLLRHWNLARGLDRSYAYDMDVVEATRLLATLALWVHETSPGVGLVAEQELHQQLVKIYEGQDISNPDQAAQSFLLDARAYTGLLMERGPGVFGFIHLSFQEYLAAVGIAQLGQGDLRSILDMIAKHVDDDNWHEVLLLAIGYIGVIQQRNNAASEILVRLMQQQPGKPGNAEIVAGEAALDVWPGGISAECRIEIIQTLTNVLSNDVKVLLRQRVRAGQVLARLGDPRPGVLDVDQMHFCYVPPGSFWMGSNNGRENEKPLHQLDIPYSYWMARFPVTNAQFAAFVESGGYIKQKYWQEAKEMKLWHDGRVKEVGEQDPRSRPHDWGHPFNVPNHPVVGITWMEALAFTRWLSETWRKQGVLSSGWLVALPSEAEWEKAARGGFQIPSSPIINPMASDLEPSVDQVSNPEPQRGYTWGKEVDQNRANYQASNIESSNAVGCFPGGTSPYGCEEMLGNVREWTRSLERSYPYKPDDGREQIPTITGKRFILRGGAYTNSDNEIRCSYRGRNISLNVNYRGFRIAIVPDPVSRRRFSIEDYGWKFVHNITPPDNQIAEMYRYIQGLQAQLLKQPIKEDPFSELVIYGSVARGTTLVPIADVDVLLLLKLDPLKDNPRLACALAREVLRGRFSGKQLVDSRLVRQGRSLGSSTIIQLAKDLRLEVTPAVVSHNDSDQILIPDWRMQKWIVSNHKEHIEFADTLDNQSNGLFKALVKITKYWQSYPQRKKFFHNFVMECLVAANFDFEDMGPLQAFQLLLEKFRNRYDSPRKLQSVPTMGVPNKTETTGILRGDRYREFMILIENTLAKIDQIEKLGSLAEKTDGWKNIFGNQFPEEL